MNKKILQLALPSIVSNITVPLLGLVDGSRRTMVSLAYAY